VRTFFFSFVAFHLLFFLGQAWAEGNGKLATCRHRADSGGEMVYKVHRRSLDRLHASMIKQKNNGKRLICHSF
jgi:hypothetical protein